MVKKILFTLLLGIFIGSNAVHAGVVDQWKENSAIKKELKATEKIIKNYFELQTLYSNAKDYEKLKDFYAENYRNSDAFDKNTTFKIIKENYDIYPNLKMTTQINSIDINGKYATVDVYEYAQADDIKREDITLKGSLEAFAHTIYYLEKYADKWLITSEHAIEENNSVVFGEAQYLDIKLSAPQVVAAGDTYTATLEVNNLPRKGVLMGSISQTPAVYPINEEEDDDDAYRIFDDTNLERIFTANKNNINEYNIASIGLARSQPIPTGGVKFYLSGLAFVMTRVNVIPENKFYEKTDDNEEDDD